MPNDPLPTATVDRPLNRKAQELRDAHYREYAEAIEQRDAALAENERAKQLCTSAKHEINALHEQINELKGRCTAYQLERDEAVAKFAKLSGFLTSLFAQMNAFQILPTPKQTVAPDAEAPRLVVPKIEDAMAEELKGDWSKTTKIIAERRIRGEVQP